MASVCMVCFSGMRFGVFRRNSRFVIGEMCCHNKRDSLESWYHKKSALKALKSRKWTSVDDCPCGFKFDED
jgi:hypothetical protein